METTKVWYAVYPGSEKLDLGPRRAIAVFSFKSQADQFSELWGEFADIQPVAPDAISELLALEEREKYTG